MKIIYCFTFFPPKGILSATSKIQVSSGVSGVGSTGQQDHMGQTTAPCNHPPSTAYGAQEYLPPSSRGLQRGRAGVKSVETEA